jgi:phosphate butyryltransferase
MRGNSMFKSFSEVISAASSRGPVRVAVAQAADEEVLSAMVKARRKGIVEGVLVGEEVKITNILKNLNENPADYTIISAVDYSDCAKKAVSVINNNQADVLMKGILPTADYLRPILDKNCGLYTGRLISQISIFEWAEKQKLFFITDCAINIAPDINQKKSILLNSLELARSLGLAKPRVAILASQEIVKPEMPETIDADVLAKMAEQGEFKDAIVDGPLAFDNAFSEEAALQKGTGGLVAGKADILIVPDLSTGNAIHKALVHFAHLPTAGVIIGARVPIISTSRGDDSEVKYYSLAVANLLANRSS